MWILERLSTFFLASFLISGYSYINPYVAWSNIRQGQIINIKYLTYDNLKKRFYAD